MPVALYFHTPAAIKTGVFQRGVLPSGLCCWKAAGGTSLAVDTTGLPAGSVSVLHAAVFADGQALARGLQFLEALVLVLLA